MYINTEEFTKENVKILKNFVTCVDERSLDKMTNGLYEHLHVYGPFIAHYNISGFKHTYSDFQFLDFVKQLTYPIYPIRRDEEHIRQVNKMNDLMQEYILSQKSKIEFEFENKLMQAKINKLKALANDLGFDIVPKGQDKATDSVALLTNIEENGQVSLF